MCELWRMVIEWLFGYGLLNTFALQAAVIKPVLLESNCSMNCCHIGSLLQEIGPNHRK